MLINILSECEIVFECRGMGEVKVRSPMVPTGKWGFISCRHFQYAIISPSNKNI